MCCVRSSANTHLQITRSVRKITQRHREHRRRARQQEGFVWRELEQMHQEGGECVLHALNLRIDATKGFVCH